MRKAVQKLLAFRNTNDDGFFMFKHKRYDVLDTQNSSFGSAADYYCVQTFASTAPKVIHLSFGLAK
jgi:hypothetical protein